MAACVTFVDESGEVRTGVPVSSEDLTSLVEFLHRKIDLCSDALGDVDKSNRALSGSGRLYKTGKFNDSKDCEFCTHYAARILAKYELKERA